MPLSEWLLWLIAFAVLLAVAWMAARSWRNGISPMPASRAVRRLVIEEVNRISGYASIVEAGSGWGTMGLDVVRHCPGKRLTGIENSSIPLWCSQLLARLAVRSRTAGTEGGSLRGRVHFRRGDIYRHSYRDADIVLCYLYPGAMKQLEGKFRQELAHGAAVISVCFAIPGRRPVRTLTCGDALRTKVYVYIY